MPYSKKEKRKCEREMLKKIAKLSDRRRTKCPNCKKKTWASYSRVMIEREDDMTEGQEADYLAASSSGEFGEWGADRYEGVCEHCKKPFVLQVIS